MAFFALKFCLTLPMTILVNVASAEEQQIECHTSDNTR